MDAMDAMEENTSGMLVAVRLRPISENERQQGHRSCCRVVGDQAVVIEKFGRANGHLKSQQSSSNEYAYDIAFSDQASQEEVYTKTVKDIIPTILNGYSATIFAYGATGAGKTHTMMGSERDGLGEDEDFVDAEIEVDGIIPHALTDIFRLIDHRREEEAILNLSHGSTFDWTVQVSYLEVYNEQIRDLLQPSSAPLALREDQARGIVHVAGLHHETAHSVGEVLQLLRRGNRNRKTESTAANVVSSRSHAVIQVIIRHTTTVMLSESHPRKSIVEGKLSLIDLAGSERASTTQNRGMRLTEGANINKSLLALANCINSLSAQTKTLVRRSSYESVEGIRRTQERRAIKVRSKVQYRDSKLTHLLKNSLEGECRLVMIANVNPSHASFDESHNTLKYANRAKNIKIRPKMHVTTAEMTYQQRIEKLESENVQLRTSLATVQEECATITKRKSTSTVDDISPNTLKKFKNFPWGSEDAEEARRRQREKEEIEALHTTIGRLEIEKAALESKVTVLTSENQRLRYEQKQQHRGWEKPEILVPKQSTPAPFYGSNAPVTPLKASELLFEPSSIPPSPASEPTRGLQRRTSMIPRLNHSFSRELQAKRDTENQPSVMNSQTNDTWHTVSKHHSSEHARKHSKTNIVSPSIGTLRRPVSYRQRTPNQRA